MTDDLIREKVKDILYESFLEDYAFKGIDESMLLKAIGNISSNPCGSELKKFIKEGDEQTKAYKCDKCNQIWEEDKMLIIQSDNGSDSMGMPCYVDEAVCPICMGYCIEIEN